VIFVAIIFALISCSDHETLKIRQFHLRSAEVSNGNDFIRGEMNKRLYGAVSLDEREARKGHYYDISWKGLSGEQPVTVLFEYRQELTGADEKMIKRILAPATDGKVEIQILGESYHSQGRVLAWQVTLLEGSEQVAQKKSYLWE
jgi:hypothetical protein